MNPGGGLPFRACRASAPPFSFKKSIIYNPIACPQSSDLAVLFRVPWEIHQLCIHGWITFSYGQSGGPAVLMERNASFYAHFVPLERRARRSVSRSPGNTPTLHPGWVTFSRGQSGGPAVLIERNASFAAHIMPLERRAPRSVLRSAGNTPTLHPCVGLHFRAGRAAAPPFS